MDLELARAGSAGLGGLFGTLAQRSGESRETIRLFLEALRPKALKVFDVNLRQNFFSADIL